MPKKMIQKMLPAAVLLLLCGCLFPAYREVREFDLDIEPVKSSVPLRISAVRDNTGNGIRMVSRSSVKLQRDPYNTWAQEPAALVQNALNRSLSTDGKAAAFDIVCELDRFEAMPDNERFLISGFFFKRSSAETIRFDIAVPLQSNRADSIAFAASEAVRKLAERIAVYGKTLK